MRLLPDLHNYLATAQRLAPTWGDLADEFKSDEDVVIAHVDCTNAQETCSKLEVGCERCRSWLEPCRLT
jgi:hypothetical protein